MGNKPTGIKQGGDESLVADDEWNESALFDANDGGVGVYTRYPREDENLPEQPEALSIRHTGRINMTLVNACLVRKKNESISHAINEGFMQKIFGPPIKRRYRLPACYYKMRSIGEQGGYTDKVVVVGPGAGGSCIYHSKAHREMITVGPRESKFFDGMESLQSFTTLNFESKMINGLNRFIEKPEEWTFENDAMVPYRNDDPSRLHLAILKVAYHTITAIPFGKVVLKIFVNDWNYRYNDTLRRVAAMYKSFRIFKPDGGSPGSTERYLLLEGRADGQNVRCETRRIFFSELSEALTTAYIELMAREHYNIPAPQGPLEQRQMDRINDVERYWQMEVSQMMSHLHRIWHRTGITSEINKDLITAYVSSDKLTILKYDAHHQAYMNHTIPGIGTEIAFGRYDAIYDGTRTIDVKSELRIIGGQSVAVFVPEDDDVSFNICIAIEGLRLFQAKHKLEAVNFEAMKPHTCRTTLVEGVPGCGKTYEIVHSCPPDALVLTVTVVTKEEIQKKIDELGKHDVTVRTVDSFFLNCTEQFETVYLDEGLMIQPGEIDMIANLTDATRIRVYGDRKQLNFIPRVAGYIAIYDHYPDFANIEYRSISYRCPQDVSQIFYEDYETGFFTRSAIRKSIAIKKISGVLSIPIDANAKYLTFTQNEKKELLKYSYDVRTIHEVQGMTFKNVILVRLNPRQLTIYNSYSHILVACTRHTNNFIYASVATYDKTAKTLMRDREIDVTNIALAHAVHGRHEDTENLTCVQEAPDVGIIEVGYQLRWKPTSYRETFTALQELLFERLTITMGALFEPNDFDYGQWVPEIIREGDIKNTEEYIGPYIPVAAPDVMLQLFYEDTLPNEFMPEVDDWDEYKIETSDMEFTLPGSVIDEMELYAHLDKTVPRYTHVPRISTKQPNLRQRTGRQMCLALQKRNCDAPANTLPLAMDVEINKTVDTFKQAYCVEGIDDILTNYQNEPITFNAESLKQWVGDLEEKKIKKFDWKDENLALEDLIRYSMMIKAQPKNRMEVGSENEYAAAATIVHHKHTITALFGTVFKQLFTRFTNILKPNVVVMLKKNNSTIERILNTFLSPTVNYDTLEADFEKFDKSQLEMCHEMEMVVYTLLGLDQYLHMMWKMCHIKTSAVDFITHIKIYLLYQRKTGDVSTCFGNTLVSMLSLSRAVDLKKMIIAMFVGDDSFIKFAGEVRKRDIVRTLSEVFNLSAKLANNRVTYMCSAYIINNGTYYVVVPDPLKRIERLGQKFIINDESEFAERWQSFSQLMRPLEDEFLYDDLAYAIAERFNFPETSSYAIVAFQSLRTLAHDYEKFRDMWTSTIYAKPVKTSSTALKALSGLSTVLNKYHGYV